MEAWGITAAIRILAEGKYFWKTSMLQVVAIVQLLGLVYVVMYVHVYMH